MEERIASGPPAAVLERERERVRGIGPPPGVLIGVEALERIASTLDRAGS
jgi:hypothetical protein